VFILLLRDIVIIIIIYYFFSIVTVRSVGLPTVTVVIILDINVVTTASYNYCPSHYIIYHYFRHFVNIFLLLLSLLICVNFTISSSLYELPLNYCHYRNHKQFCYNYCLYYHYYFFFFFTYFIVNIIISFFYGYSYLYLCHHCTCKYYNISLNNESLLY